MFRDCAKLMKIQFLRFLQLNELIHGKDKKKRKRAVFMAVSYLLLGAMLVLYVGLMAFSLSFMGLADLIPSYMISITSLVILLFSILKANGILFGARDYEMLTSLPLHKKAIVLSRFLTMYTGNLVFSAAVMLPAASVYASITKPGAGVYVMMVSSLFLIPLIPLAAASLFGALLAAITARLKHKNLITIVFSMLFCLGIVVFSFKSSELDMSALSDFLREISLAMRKIYPLAGIYGKAVTENNIAAYLLFAVISIAVFVLFVLLISRRYEEINSALSATAAKRNYAMRELKMKTPLRSLYEKEARRYLSSSVYVLNTGFGYVMLLAFAVFLLFSGMDKVEESIGIQGMDAVMGKLLPFLIGFMVCVSATTQASISLEGKHWGMLLSLPVSTKTIFDAKILLNLTLSVPSVILASAIFSAACRLHGTDIFFLFLLSIVYCLFSAVTGIFINRKLLDFNWDNEAAVIKGASGMMNAAVGLIFAGTPAIGSLLLPAGPAAALSPATAVLLLCLTGIIYRGNIKVDLRILSD